MKEGMFPNPSYSIGTFFSPFAVLGMNCKGVMQAREVLRH
jgi:hypothetical protein